MNGDSSAHPHAAARTTSAKRFPVNRPAIKVATGTANTHGEKPRLTGAASHITDQATFSAISAIEENLGLLVSTTHTATKPHDSTAWPQLAACVGWVNALAVYTAAKMATATASTRSPGL